MNTRNSTDGWGWPSIAFHWLTALAVFGLFGLGLWMVELDYYHPWYHRAPELHKAIGMLLLFLVVLRLAWRLANPVPMHEPGPARWERAMANAAHVVLYLLLFATLLAGYLMATAEGGAVSVFGWFHVPALLYGLPEQEDIAGEIHEVLAWTLIAVVAVHAAGALKNHFVHRNNTLKRMLGIGAAPAARGEPDASAD